MNRVDLEGILTRDPVIFDGKYGKFVKFTLLCSTRLGSKDYQSRVPCACNYALYEKYEAFMKEGCEVRCCGYFRNHKNSNTGVWRQEIGVTDLKARQPIDPTGGIAAQLRAKKEAATQEESSPASQPVSDMPTNDFMSMPFDVKDPYGVDM